MILLTTALAAPVELHVQSPTPVQVLVDGQLRGTSWLEKRQEVQLREGQDLVLRCGSTELEPIGVAERPLVVITHQAEGPCKLGGGEAKLLAILGTPNNNSEITAMWDDEGGEPGLGDLDAALAGVEKPAPQPSPNDERPLLRFTGLKCVEGCEGDAGDALKRVVRRYSGQLRYCAEKHRAEPGRLTLTLERDGTAVRSVRVEGSDTATSGCMASKMKRWRLPETAPERAVYTAVLAPGK